MVFRLWHGHGSFCSFSPLFRPSSLSGTTGLPPFRPIRLSSVRLSAPFRPIRSIRLSTLFRPIWAFSPYQADLVFPLYGFLPLSGTSGLQPLSSPSPLPAHSRLLLFLAPQPFRFFLVFRPFAARRFHCLSFAFFTDARFRVTLESLALECPSLLRVQSGKSVWRAPEGES